MEEALKPIDWAPFRAEFPHLFREAWLEDMGVGEGWFDLLWALCASLEITATLRANSGLHPFRITQVKEKFGGLRFYTTGDIPMEAWELIQETCARSEFICEACGSSGSRCVIDGWIKTLCPAHQMNMSAKPSHGGPKCTE